MTKSISGNRFTLGGSVIPRRSVRQIIIVRSTMKYEYVALEMVDTEDE